MFFKILKIISSVILTVLLSYGIIYAWNGLTASDGDTLTYTKWNELVDKVTPIFSSGSKVGIGTSSPDVELDIVGAINLDGTSGDNPSRYIKFGPSSNSVNYYINVPSDTNNGFEINNNGYWSGVAEVDVNQSMPRSVIAIGRGNNAFKLYTAESNGITQFNGNDKFVIKYDGRVGVGVLNPKEKLDIDGGIKLANTTCDNDRIGTIAYDSITDSFRGCRNNLGTPSWINLH